MRETIVVRPEEMGGLNLAETLDCGQAFRWKPVPDEKAEIWEGIAGNHYLRIRREHNELRFECSSGDFEGFWKNYFDLNVDYSEKKKQLALLDPVMRDAIGYAPGIRLLRQEPFEVMCSFILSQNCNIPRIKGMIERLCALCGESIGQDQSAFPTPVALAAQGLDGLEPVRAGFRAKYLLSAAEAAVSGRVQLEKIYDMDIDEGRETLQQIRGIGPKVAECILLFGYHKLEAFPMDVWMKRVMEAFYPGKSPSFFGSEAGLAQQYLFHYARNRRAIENGKLTIKV